jgi:hypothetical protein
MEKFWGISDGVVGRSRWELGSMKLGEEYDGKTSNCRTEKSCEEVSGGSVTLVGEIGRLE